MAEKATANIIWEDNPDTPIDASGLSSSLDYQSQSKFLYYTDTDDDYIEWADYVINLPDWPTDNQTPEVNWNDGFLGSVVYNEFDNLAKTAFIGSGDIVQWAPLSSPYKKIIKILSGTKITSSYIKSSTSEIQYESFNFSEDQVFSVDDLLEGETNLSVSSFYSIVLYHHYNYGEQAAIKLVNSIYDNAVDDNSWKKDGINVISPSGYKVISYRKIGGFWVDSDGYIEEDTLWDLSTYRSELTIEKIKIDNGGVVEELEAKHIPIQRVSGDVQFSTNNVQDALVETREVLNNLSSSFYTNRRGGLNLRYAFGKKSTSGNPNSPLTALSTNEIALVITAGFIDVSGSESIFDNDLYLANDNVEININDGENWVSGRMLGSEETDQDNNHLKIYPGIWRVFIDELGRINLKGSDIPGGVPVWSSSKSGWYDSVNLSRCIGKFSVSTSGGVYYIDKMSITNTLDFEPPIGTLFHFHGTMCPDGLIPCDGFWHDVTGNNSNSYTIGNLPDISVWGNSWYEEAPLLMGKTLKMSDTPTITPGEKFDIETGVGGSDDAGATGGSDDHKHTYEHDHGTGTIYIAPSGEHAHGENDFTVDAPGSEERIEVTENSPGSFVAIGGHIHDVSTSGAGEHVHSNQEVQGNTASTQIANDDADTSATSSWPSYKEILICIKK